MSLKAEVVVNRRDAERRALRRMAVLLFPGGQQFEVRTVDISTSGIGIVVPANPPIRLVCRIRFSVPVGEKSQATLELKGQVTDSVYMAAEAGFKVGLRFLEIERSQLKTIGDFVRP